MTAPDRYRKKPVVIDAIQWTGENLRAVIGFTDGPPNTRTSHAGMMWDQYEDLVRHEGLKIYTLEGKMNADVGDYIIKGVKGEFYPCKPEIFAATYEPADLARTTPLAEALAVPEIKALVEAASPLMSMAMWTETAEDTEMVIVSVGTVRRIRAALRTIERKS